MAVATLPTSFISQPTSHYACATTVQAPPSPPSEDSSRCSLPSISNLIGLADAGSPTSESFATRNTVPQSALPPTPPMSTDASFDGNLNSPPSRSVSSASCPPNYYADAATRQEVNPRYVPRSVAAVFTAPDLRSTFVPTTYIGTQTSISAYYPAMQPTPQPQPQVSGLFYQRPLPTTFPPLPMSVGFGHPGNNNPWQHHHYISPSAAAAFPQSQDRYICQTCSKAFSRPSSLRIHSHSHTGEKPFKCPHTGCGKAFSVRSNMKRHERGCHNFQSSGNNNGASLSALLSGDS